ncbi:MAG: BrnT family toxin [Halobacteriovoraceae bacterium]|nr:BrnT family toxin [Halobacteriovoraceae bacterium]
MYAWDEHKSTSNKTKHGISFEEARDYIFEDRNITVMNVAYDKEEQRHAIIGKYNGKYYTGIFTIRDDKIRIISVRRSRNAEKQKAKSKGL